MPFLSIDGEGYFPTECFNQKTKSTYTYTTGTLGTATATVSYAYGNAKWKDLMTTYNGQSISYDGVGNPLTYRDGMTMTCE